MEQMKIFYVIILLENQSAKVLDRLRGYSMETIKSLFNHRVENKTYPERAVMVSDSMLGKMKVEMEEETLVN